MILDLQTAISLLLSIVSIAFGAYQYFDKRKIEKKNAELLNRKAELELKEKEFQTKADPVVYYLETNFASIFSYSRGLSARAKQEPMGYDEFDKAMKIWVEALEETLPFKVKISLMGNSQYEELRKYCVAPEEGLPSKHTIIAMLIRNEGKYPATRMNVNFHDFDKANINKNAIPKDECLPVRNVIIDILRENEASLILVNHYSSETFARYGIELEPDHTMKYYDKLLEKEVEMKVRIPYEVPRMVDKGLLIRG